jgi:hypothetical protein
MYNQLINEAEVMKTWAPIVEEATGVSDKSKLTWMSKYCHFHNLSESVHNSVHLNPNVNVPGMGNTSFPDAPGTLNNFAGQGTGSGDRPFSLLPLAMQVAAQTIGLDLVPVVPMQGPMGILTYLDFVYAGGRKVDTKAAPLLIKFSVDDNAGGLPAPALIEGAVYYAGATVAGAASHSFELTYVKNSRIDGHPIFRVRALVSDAAGTYQQGAETAPESIAQAIQENVDIFNTTAIAGSAPQWRITSKAELVKALEDHVTGFSGVGFEESTGDGFNNPSTTPAAVGGSNFPNIGSQDPYLRGQGEDTPDNLMGLNLFNKSVAAQTFQVAAGVTREQVQDLKQFGIDAVAQVEAVLVNELTQSINKLILDRIFRNGVTNAQEVFAVDGFSLSARYMIGGAAALGNITIGAGNTSNVPVTLTNVPGLEINVGQGGETQGTLQRRLLSRILAATNLISTRGRRGPATFAVVGGKIGTALQDIAGFVPYPLANTVNQAGGSLYPIGAIAGVTVYVDPTMSWNDGRVAVGRKGDGNSPGLVFMPYLMAESVETIAEGTMAPKIAVKSRFALVDAGFHPETMYYTLVFDFDDGVDII